MRRSSTRACARGRSSTEALLSPGEVDSRPNHPLITQVPIAPIDLEKLGALVAESRDPQVFTHRSGLEGHLTRLLDSETAPVTGDATEAIEPAATSSRAPEPDADPHDTGVGL